MFDTIESIWIAIGEFEKKTNKRPNILFINNYNKTSFMQLIYSDYINNSRYGISAHSFHSMNEIIIFGLKVKWSNNIEGVDYIEEFDQRFMQQQKVFKPLTKIKSNRRKIIL